MSEQVFIDDDEVITSIYKLWFKDEFKELHVPTNKEELDEILKTEKIHIVFCDVRLKKKFLFLHDGFEVCEYIRNNYDNKITFFIITGLERYNYYEDYKKHSYIQGFIEKPFDKSDIMKIFEN